MLNRIKQMQLHAGVLYLSGATTIMALRPLPAITLTHAAGSNFTLPATTAIGRYHLLITDGNGKQQQLHNVLEVKMPTFSKPKMSKDEFKKLLEEKRRDSSLFSAPQ
jgi:hypothetical protein